MAHAKMINVSGNHYKFYCLAVQGSQVVIEHGRIRSWKQTKVRQFSTTVEAMAYLAKKVAQKLGRGYEMAPYFAQTV